MLGIACHFQKGFCTGAKQEIVEDLLVLQHQGSQVTRKRENHMDVTRGKKFPATLFQPTFASSGLTLRAVAISTGIERDGAMSAAGALVDVTAERGGATADGSGQDLQVQPGEPFLAAFVECRSRCADPIGHL